VKNRKPDEKKERRLTLQQEQFCKLFVSEDFFGNGTQAYIAAYGIDVSRKGAYDAARASSSELLTKANVNARITELVDSAGLNDHNVDKQLLIAIQQNAEFGSKVSAIREYNKLKARIKEDTKEPVTVVVEIKQVP
jgi:hypothetical protein